MNANEDWKIPSLSSRCGRCEAALQPGSEVTALLRLASEGPERCDLCERCAAAASPGEQAFFWRRRIPQDGERRVVVDYALLREVFERMLARSEEIYRRLSYLVALVLVRKRHLRLAGFEVRGGREVMVVQRRVGEPEFVVPAPHLNADQMVETRAALARLLQADPGDGLPADLLERAAAVDAVATVARDDAVDEVPPGTAASAGASDAPPAAPQDGAGGRGRSARH